MSDKYWESRAKAGDKVVFAHPRDGSKEDRAIGELLTEGQSYTLRLVIPGDLLTELAIEEMSGRFNSVQFEPAGSRAGE